MNISNKINFLIILFVLFLMQSCASLQIRKMQLKAEVEEPVILNLCNYGDNQIDFFKQSENLMKGYLIKNVGEEYGYYVIKHDTRQESSIFTFVLSAVLPPLLLLGVPAISDAFYLQAKLYIFDSQGDLVKEYEDTSYLKHVGGLYYGYNPTKKVAKRYSRMYKEIFEVARLQAVEINGILKQCGPINDKNEKKAKANIEAFFKKKGETYKKTSGHNIEAVPIGVPQSQPSNSENNVKEPLRISDFNQGLEIGKYYCVQNPNLWIQMLFGIFTLSDGDRALIVGNYKSHGDKLVVSVYEGKFKGQTFTYIIEDSKHFRHSFEDESWVHESAY